MGLMCLMGMGFRTEVCCSQYKAHSCMHMVLMSEFMNPRMVWCFEGETFMGVMRLLGEASNKSCSYQGSHETHVLMFSCSYVLMFLYMFSCSYVLMFLYMFALCSYALMFLCSYV